MFIKLIRGASSILSILADGEKTLVEDPDNSNVAFPKSKRLMVLEGETEEAIQEQGKKGSFNNGGFSNGLKKQYEMTVKEVPERSLEAMTKILSGDERDDIK